MSDVMSNLRDHAPTLASLKEIDTSVLTDRLPRRSKRKGVIALVLGVLATGVALNAYLRRRNEP